MKARLIDFYYVVLLFSSVVLNADRQLSISARVDTTDVYVQAQAILTIEIKTELSFQNGSLSKPEIPGAIVEPLVEDDQREMVDDGVRTLVFVRSYAIFPSKIGKVTIPSIVFEAVIQEPGSHGFGFFGRGRKIKASTEAITLNVKAIPSNYPKNQPFLPVKSLSIVESFDEDNPEVQVNKALTRRFEIRALGTLTSFLPTIKAPRLKNCEVYSESGSKEQERSADGLLASVNFSQVYLPSSPGKITVPEQVIYWWDTDVDDLKTTPIRSFELKVSGDELKQEAEAAPALPQDASPPPPAAPAESAASNAFYIYVWPALAGLFFILWMTTLVIFIRYKNIINKARVEKPENNSLDVLMTRIIKSCDKKHDHDLLAALQDLNKYYSGDHESVHKYISIIEDKLYGSKNKIPDDIYNNIKNSVARWQKREKSHENPLPVLYPL
jgi:hypothetical protein